MGKKSKKHQEFKKLSSHTRGAIKQQKRKEEKFKRLKIKKIKNPIQTPIGQLQTPNLNIQKKQFLESLARKKNSKKYEQTINKSNKVEFSQLQFMNQQGNSMEFEELEERQTNNLKNQKNISSILDQILENSDILLEVLDARDPMGCRCRALEQKYIQYNPSHKIILVLNKIDLVPQNIVAQWKQILSNEFPTVVFKANLQKQNKNLGYNDIYTKSLTERPELREKLVNSSKALGTQKLLELIKNYSKVSGQKTSVTVGVIGFPNVGKSSLINSMIKKRAVSVSSNPGHTKHLQRIELDNQVTILDSPGVFFSNEDETTLLLRNTIKVEDVKDQEKAIETLLTVIDKEQLMKLYSIQDYRDYKEFLIQVAQVKGRYKTKGILNLEETAKMVIQDWCRGRISYYKVPPIEQTPLQKALVFGYDQQIIYSKI